MRKVITLKRLEPTILVAFVLTFAVAFMLGQQTASREDVYSFDKVLTLDTCRTAWECETAQLIADNQDGKLVRTDDPIFFPDAVPVIEPIACEKDDTECEQFNKLNAGKPANYPAICEPYIFGETK